MTSDEGGGNALDGFVHYKLSDELDAWGVKDSDDSTDGNGKTDPAIMGQPIEVLLAGDTDWNNAIRCRVWNRLVQAGKVKLAVRGINEET